MRPEVRCSVNGLEVPGGSKLVESEFKESGKHSASQVGIQEFMSMANFNGCVASGPEERDARTQGARVSEASFMCRVKTGESG